MKIRLSHYSKLKEAYGNPGDVIDCPGDIGQRFIDAGGAKLVEDSPVVEPVVKPLPKPSRKAKTETE